MANKAERTAASLRQSLLTLIETQSYEAIHVRDLYTHAGVSRATFYRHYNNKHDLLVACLEEMSEQLKATLTFPGHIPPEQTGQYALANMVNLFTHIEEHRWFYTVVLIDTAVSLQAQLFLRRLLRGSIKLTVYNSGLFKNFPVSPDIVLSMVVGGVLELIQWWLAHDEETLPYTPELLAECVLRMSERGIFGFGSWPGTPYDVTSQPFLGGPNMPNDT